MAIEYIDQQVTQALIQPYLTVRTQFKNNNGLPIEIKQVTFSVLDAQSGADVNIKQHHLPLANYPSTGWVQADIDTSNLAPDKDYVFKFEVVDVNGFTHVSTSTVKMFRVSRTQWLIDQLRTLLLDQPSFGKWIPQHVHQRYLIRKPWEVEWQNEELFSYLNMSLSDINNSIPPTIQFTLENCPAVAYLLLGGALYALMGRGLVEVYNYYDTNAPVKVNLYKADKFKTFMDWVDKNYRQQVQQWKKAYAIYESSKPKALVLTKLPFTVIRPLSMMYGYGNLYQW